MTVAARPPSSNAHLVAGLASSPRSWLAEPWGQADAGPMTPEELEAWDIRQRWTAGPAASGGPNNPLGGRRWRASIGSTGGARPAPPGRRR